MRRLNGWLTICWILMLPVSLLMGWFDDVFYISALSLWALVSGHWSAWQAARVECEQQREYEEMLEHPIEERVVKAVVQETTLEPAPERPGARSSIPSRGNALSDIECDAHGAGDAW